MKSMGGVLLALCLALLAGTALAQEPMDDEEYVEDDEVCEDCHDDVFPHYAQTAHAKVLNTGNARTALMQRGCEACHGPAYLHVEDEDNTTKGLRFVSGRSEDPATENAVCLGCHEDADRRYWHGSAHDAAEVSCSSCHTVMKAVSRQGLLAARTETKTCGTCHAVVRSQLYRNAHMPVREEKMSCSSCHNSHGTIADALISDHTVNDNCYRCHAEKRGPFLWEHSPVYENCLNCHKPHGSTRHAMLTVSQPRLCQQCHATGHGGLARSAEDRVVIGRSCLQCHEAVHGSNHPSGSGFTR
jgi:DmsE family decaheme c-type cytochrome